MDNGDFDSRTIAAGTKAAWPICLGYIPIGLAFGVVAQKAGFTPAEIGLMSLMVFAGSSQFIAVSLLASGAGFFTIVATTFVVNLRHVLMSSALASRLRFANARWIALFAYGVTDESFGLNLSRFRNGGWDWQPALVLNHTSNLVWIMSTIAGGCGGAFIPAGAFGIDYALVAMLICLLVHQLRGGLYVLVAALSATIAVLLSLIVPGNMHVIVAALCAASFGLFIRQRQSRARTEGAR